MKLKKASVSETALFVRIILSLAFVFAFTHQSLAATIYVYDNCPGPLYNGTEADPFCKIQDGIDNATPSVDVVEVKDGTYNECITMISGVNVGSSVGVTPTINCDTNMESTVTFENGPITCDLDGFNITHSLNYGAGINLDGTSGTVTTTISNCNIHDIAASAGIRMNGAVGSVGSPTIITDNTIYKCFTSGISVGPADAPEVGDVVSDGSSITIKKNIIGDQTNANNFSGIYLKGLGTVTVVIGGAPADANTIKYNATSGIRLDTITDLTIDNNTVNNNTKAGILLIAVGSGSGDAVVRRNTINGNSQAGINIGGASYLTLGGSGTRLQYKNDIYGNHAGVVFNMKEVLGPGTPSSQQVEIIGNYIYTNSQAGIAVIDYVTGQIIIDDNEIEQNTQAGIAVFNKCTVDITDNHIFTHTAAAGIFTGDWSGLVPPDGAKFDRTNGPATLTIKRNKVHGNRAGMRLDHASGTISNNLVYGNSRTGIRFSRNNVDPYTPFSSSWGITEIKNNTVADNGSNTEVIVDNTDLGSTSSTGLWTSSTSEPGYYGSDYQYHAAAAGTDYFRWTPTISIAGTYEIFARWTSATDHASAAPYTVYHDGASTPVSKDQRSNAGEWVSLGIYSIDGENNDDYVELTQTDSGKAIADAIMFSLRRGGGIVYDAIYETTDPITGLARNFYDRPVGATQAAITIKNNILANNERAGIKYCADNSSDDRSYNLFYNNQQADCTAGNCGRMCRAKTLGRCIAPDVNCCAEESWADFAVVDFPGAWATGEICGQDPLFDANYELIPGSPAIDAGDDSNDMGAYGGGDPITW